jgi:hydrogenase nickel incorporation protein HypA/HybF
VYCATCCEEQSLPSIQDLACPQCGGPTPQVLSGREIEVFALEITQ